MNVYCCPMVKVQLTFWIQFLGHPEGPRVPVIEERVLRTLSVTNVGAGKDSLKRQ